jgi:hypothetical protein
MKINKLTILVGIIFLMPLLSCQSFQEGLAGKKKKSGDEFLVQKKNPLVKPENFDELPQPSEKTKDGNSKVDDEDNIEDLFQIDTKEVSATSTTMSPLEKSILKKINEN